MSFILDALKKSDKERRQGSIPDLQSQHTIYPGFGSQRKKKPKTLWFVLLTTVLLAFSGIALYLVAPYLPFSLTISPKHSATAAETIPADPPKKVLKVQPPQEPATVEHPTHPAPEPTKGNSISVTPEHKEQPVEQPVEQHVPQPEQQPAAATPIPTAEESTPEDTAEKVTTIESLPFLGELPENVRADIPKLRFAGHTYSEAPTKRMIIINNKIIKEKQWIEKGLFLEEITWDGVILNFNGVRFQVITTQ